MRWKSSVRCPLGGHHSGSAADRPRIHPWHPEPLLLHLPSHSSYLPVGDSYMPGAWPDQCREHGLGTGTLANRQLCVTRNKKVLASKVLEKLRCCTLFHKVYSSSPLALFNAIITLLNFSLFNVTQPVFFCYHLFN